MQLIKNTQLFPAAYLAYMTGMRKGEMSALKWENVYLENNTIKVIHSMVEDKGQLIPEDTKTQNSKRSIFVDNTVKNYLKK